MAKRGRSFVKNLMGWGNTPGWYVIGFYIYEHGKKKGFIPQSGRYHHADDARLALRRGKWRKP